MISHLKHIKCGLQRKTTTFILKELSALQKQTIRLSIEVNPCEELDVLSLVQHKLRLKSIRH